MKIEEERTNEKRQCIDDIAWFELKINSLIDSWSTTTTTETAGENKNTISEYSIDWKLSIMSWEMGESRKNQKKVFYLIVSDAHT